MNLARQMLHITLIGRKFHPSVATDAVNLLSLLCLPAKRLHDKPDTSHYFMQISLNVFIPGLCAVIANPTLLAKVPVLRFFSGQGLSRRLLCSVFQCFAFNIILDSVEWYSFVRIERL